MKEAINLVQEKINNKKFVRKDQKVSKSKCANMNNVNKKKSKAKENQTKKQ
jgi:hypothetical protein